MADPPNREAPSSIRDQLGRCTEEASKAVRSTHGSAALAVADGSGFCAHSSISDERANLNARHSLLNRLPVELWCGIWEWLPFIDRTRILDVCKAWRSIARTTPCLWSEIRCYSTVHNRNACRCRDCFAHDGYYQNWAGGWFASPYRKDATNLKFVRGVFEIGGAQSLHLSVDIIPCNAAPSVLDELAAICNDHAARIVEIHWRTGHPFSFHRFLSTIPRLPCLQRITVEWLPDIDPLEEPGRYQLHNLSDVIPRTVELPNLRHLSFDGMHFEHSTNVLPPMPALHSISLNPQDPEVLISLIRHCPGLTSLAADLERAPAPPLTVDDTLAQEFRLAFVRARAIENVLIRHFEIYEDWAFSSFHRSSAGALSLHYTEYRDVHVGHRIFGDLKGNIRVTCSRVGDDYRVHATDDFRRSRAILVSRDIAAPLARASHAVLPHHITSLTVELSLWRDVAPVPLGSAITTLTLTIPDRIALLEDAVDLHAERFPSLETVYITSDVSRDPPLTIEDVVALIPRLGLALPLPHTVIDHRIARRGQHLPRALSLRTSVE